MDLLLRDTRHLKGTTPTTAAPVPPDAGHCVAFSWSDGAPRLYVRPDDAPTKMLELPLDAELDVEVLPERLCVGRHTDNCWRPCPRGAPADRFDRCIACHPMAPRRECIFDPVPDCGHRLCASPHRVYVAFYGELPKVGMTAAARGETRQVEQGADAHAIVAHAPDRVGARQMESRLARMLGLPEWRRAHEVLPRLAQEVPWQRIEATYATLARQAGEITGEAPGPLVRLDAHIGRLPLPEPPVLAGIEGHHRGAVVAVKGRYVVYRAQDEGPLWALNASSVAGHRVRFHAGSAARASSHGEQRT